jgi:hypothetical protein
MLSNLLGSLNLSSKLLEDGTVQVTYPVPGISKDRVKVSLNKTYNTLLLDVDGKPYTTIFLNPVFSVIKSASVSEGLFTAVVAQEPVVEVPLT